MFFVNASETIGMILSSGTIGITGNIVATLFLILIVLMALAMIFSIPLEFMAVLILPFCISVAAFYGNFMVPVVLILIFLSMIIAKTWIFK